MGMKKLISLLLVCLTLVLGSINLYGCGGSRGLVYELNEDEKSYVVMGFSEEMEDYPEVLEIPAKYKGKTVVKIGSMAFRNITSIKKVILSEGVEEIASSAFKGCTNIEEMNFPSTLKKYGTQAFYGCKKLPSVVIPEGMEIIPLGLLYGCESITEVTIPNGVKEVHEKSFGKTSIKKLIFPDSITTIQRYSFLDANKLEEISIGNGVKKLGQFVFSGCVALKKVELGTALKVIYSDAFKDCTALESIVIPENVDAIYGNAFNGCTSLTSVTLVGALTEKCTNPQCGVTICPATKQLGLTEHYHSCFPTPWYSSEDSSPAMLHAHWIFSHDISDPTQLAKLLVTGEVKTMHNHALGAQGDYWSYDEAKDKYYFMGKPIKEEGSYKGTDVDKDIRGWEWQESTNYILYKGEKGAWE